ncbi:MAG: sodium:proton antiporter NhaD [Bacteroidales bacterium]
MFTIPIIILFIAGYLAITLEHPLKIGKTATALLMAVALWTLYTLGLGNPHLAVEKLSENLAEVSQILFFLLGAMTIVEMIDAHKGFQAIIRWISTKNKVTLLWIIGFATFFMSSILDNLTTSIVMVTLLRKLLSERSDRMVFASIVIIAANAGGAWTPIGDVTTTMLWIGGRITSWNIMRTIFIPSIVALLVPLTVQSFLVKGKIDVSNNHFEKHGSTEPYGRLILFMGVGSLIFVPVFKTLTHLPPFMGILLGVGAMWLVTDIIHSSHEDRQHLRISHALTRIDISSVLFFLGILLAVGSLQSAGILKNLATGLDNLTSDKRVIVYVIGLLSAVIDNVPLVAAGMGMYDLSVFPIDHSLWEMLAFCAGTGGSVLVIGSAAGVVVMGMEKLEFFWYAKRISLTALLGYTAGFLTYIILYPV